MLSPRRQHTSGRYAEWRPICIRFGKCGRWDAVSSSILVMLAPANNHIRGVDWCEPNPRCSNDGKQFNLQGNNYVQTTAVDSPLSSLGSTPSPPRERDVTPWIKSLGRTLRFHARAWPSQGRVEILGPIWKLVVDRALQRFVCQYSCGSWRSVQYRA